MSFCHLRLNNDNEHFIYYPPSYLMINYFTKDSFLFDSYSRCIFRRFGICVLAFSYSVIARFAIWSLDIPINQRKKNPPGVLWPRIVFCVWLFLWICSSSSSSSSLFVLRIVIKWANSYPNAYCIINQTSETINPKWNRQNYFHFVPTDERERKRENLVMRLHLTSPQIPKHTVYN